MCVYLYFSMKFAGFPYASKFAIVRLKKVTAPCRMCVTASRFTLDVCVTCEKLGHVTVVWTIARVLWGFVALTTVLQVT